MTFSLTAVGHVSSTLTDLAAAPRQPDEGAPDTVHPRGETDRPLTGVFATRSPARPNPIGLHDVRVLEIEGARVHVRNLEALDGTPIVDVKPVLRTER